MLLLPGQLKIQLLPASQHTGWWITMHLLSMTDEQMLKNGRCLQGGKLSEKLKKHIWSGEG